MHIGRKQTEQNIFCVRNLLQVTQHLEVTSMNTQIGIRKVTLIPAKTVSLSQKVKEHI